MNLRERLRADTRTDHDALDTLASQFDLQTRHGLAAFLRMQIDGMTAVHAAVPPCAAASAASDLAARARHDLLVLDLTEASGPSASLVAIAPLAADYMVGGAQLGNAVLRKRWASAVDLAVKRANAFFEGPPHREIWTGFVAASARLPAVGANADEIVRDAKRVFAQYACFARYHLSEMEAVDARTFR